MTTFKITKSKNKKKKKGKKDKEDQINTQAIHTRTHTFRDIYFKGEF